MIKFLDIDLIESLSHSAGYIKTNTIVQTVERVELKAAQGDWIFAHSICGRVVCRYILPTTLVIVGDNFDSIRHIIQYWEMITNSFDIFIEDTGFSFGKFLYKHISTDGIDLELEKGEILIGRSK